MEATRMAEMDRQIAGQTDAPATGVSVASERTQIVIEIHDHYGYRGWVAQIVGTDQQYGLARNFLRPSERSQSQSGKTGDKTYIIDHAGIYQIGGTKRDDEIILVWHKDGKGLVRATIDSARATAMVRMMEKQHMTCDEARLATRPVVSQ